MAFNRLGKAQASLEFLTTYGWAFLVILIMIGTLAYFGILKPSKILPNRCNIGPEFQCLDHQIKYGTGADGTFKLRLKNNVGETIALSAINPISLSSEGSIPFACGTAPANLPTGNPSVWASGNILDLTWSGCNSAASGMTAGEKGKVLLKISYYSVNSGSGYAKEVNGEVFTTVIQ